MRLCIFDLDGTLTDTLDSLTESTNETLRQMDLPMVTKEQVRSFVGNGARNQIRCALKANGAYTEESLEKALTIYLEVFSKRCTNGVKIYPGMEETLQRLKAAGCLLAVHSNKPHLQAVHVVEELFPQGLFDVVLGQKKDIRRKPSPEGVWFLIEKLGVSREETIYVGDSEVDIQTGENAGILTVGVNWGFRGRQLLQEAGAQIMIDRPEDLLHYVH